MSEEKSETHMLQKRDTRAKSTRTINKTYKGPRKSVKTNYSIDATDSKLDFLRVARPAFE